MRYLDTINITRQLAKTDKYQTLCNGAKELGLRLFRNDGNYTDLQILFLNFLNFYSIINLDIALGEIDEVVLDNNIYEDSYMFFRRKSRNIDKDKTMNSPKSNLNSTNKKAQVSTSTWVFKTPPKEVK